MDETPISIAKSAHNDFLDILEGLFIDKGILITNPNNTYQEILVVPTKDIKEIIESFKYKIEEE